MLTFISEIYPNTILPNFFCEYSIYKIIWKKMTVNIFVYIIKNPLSEIKPSFATLSDKLMYSNLEVNFILL